MAVVSPPAKNALGMKRGRAGFSVHRVSRSVRPAPAKLSPPEQKILWPYLFPQDITPVNDGNMCNGKRVKPEIGRPLKFEV